MFVMFEAVTAMMGLLGAGIFLAHVFEGVLWAWGSRPAFWSDVLEKGSFGKF
jgi:hypothetical protein